jgi:hypothetical protein
MDNITKIENHYHVTVDDFIAKIVSEERARLTAVLKENNIIVEIDGELFGVAYDNWDTREEEDHSPQISLKKVS